MAAHFLSFFLLTRISAKRRWNCKELNYDGGRAISICLFTSVLVYGLLFGENACVNVSRTVLRKGYDSKLSTYAVPCSLIFPRPSSHEHTLVYGIPF